MMPTEPPTAEEPRAPEPPPAPRYRWYHKVSAVLFITICLDVGLFLLICPWTDYWDNFAAFVHNWRRISTICIFAASSAAWAW